VPGGEDTDESDGVAVSLRVALGGALAVLVAIRLIPFDSVFRGADVVLLSNDPYAYVYLVERVLTAGGIRAGLVVNWPAEPLLVWTLAIFSFLLGGVEQVDLVLAWYPVVTALVSGVLVFVLARTLTDDVRIGLTAVVLLAVTPLHVSRTALGFGDHHAFDYMWLALTATALTWLVVRTDAERRRRWQIGGVLGFAVAGQALAWQASPLLLVPTAGAVGFASLVVVRTETPVRTLAPVVAGFGLAAVLVQLVHQTLAWQNAFVAGTPALLFVGGLVVLGLLAGVDRADRSWPTLLGAELGVVTLCIALLWFAVPGFVGVAVTQVDGFTAYVERLQTSGIGETASLTETFGPILGPLVLLGFSPFLGLPATVWGVVRGWREREPAWVVLAVYVLWFLALAFVQRRWAVQLGLFLSVFAAVGFVAFAHWLALVLPPVPFRDEPPDDQETIEPPDRQRIALLGGLGAVGLGGGTLYSGYILSRLAIDDAAYAAAAWIRDYAEERDWSYPRNYVLAAWGRARMFNYLVNGESQSYGYARRNYEDFVFGGDPDEWYERFEGRVGFVVTRPRSGAAFRNNQARLHDNDGSAGDGVSGVGHYRAMWESAGGEVKVFTLVPGATVAGTGPAETTLELSTTATLDGTGRTVQYRRRVETDADGAFSVTLAQPGEYTFADRDVTVTVEDTAVREGARLVLGL
jgi:asparagine N-glycosylation enzyme membrane subunit Stt3